MAEPCPALLVVRFPSTTGYRLEARCIGDHEPGEEHAADLTRLRLRWVQEVPDAVSEGEQAEEDRDATSR